MHSGTHTPRMETGYTNRHAGCVPLLCNSRITCRTLLLHCVIWTLLLLVKHGTSAQEGLTQTFRTEENRERGTLIGTIGEGIGDPDLVPPYNSPIFILPANGERHIQVDTSNGDITVKNEPLDRESEDHYRFLVSSEQTGKSITVDIYVTDTNDNKPTFPVAVKPLELSESTPKENKIFLGSAIDADLGNNSTERYEIISGNTDHAFRLKSSKADDGILYLDLVVNGSLDHETNPRYELLIRAYDGGNPPQHGDMIVNITIVDVNDNQPIFSNSRYFAKIFENATVGTSVLQVSASDSDSGDNGKISYTIDRQRSDPQETFAIDADTGKIYVNKEVDYESQNAYELIVVARDGAAQKLQTTAVVSIEVLDVNDNEPTIDLIYLTDDGTSRISEKAAPGDFIARISISDPDVADRDPQVNVTLTGGDGHFGLTTSDNVVYFVTLTSPLDREMKPFYRLMVTATDRGTPPLSATKIFTLHVTDFNDNPPHFVQSSYRAEIPEVLPAGSSVIQVTAEDQDEGENSRISYQMLDTPESHSDWFQIDEASGLITTRTRLDCETSVQPELVIVASDTGVPPKSVTTTVTVVIEDVNDNQPVFDQSFYNVTVDEDAAVGTCILTVSALDPDCGQSGEVRYSVAEDLGFAPPAELTLDAASGQLCVALPLDYETTAAYEFPITAADQDGLHTTAMVKVNVRDVNDNRPVFYPATYSVNLAPSSSPGTEVAVVMATDADAGRLGAVTYAISAGNTAGYFGIGETSGVITVVRRLPGSAEVFALQVTARDGGGEASPTPASVTISLVDPLTQLTPVFSETLYHFTLQEDVGVRSYVGTVEAAARGGSIEYSIDSGDPRGYFTIDSGSGQLRTAARLDHETVASVLLNIQARSGNPPAFGRAQVSITITDVNDNSPQFPSDSIEISVKENLAPGSVIYGLRAVDTDSGANGRVTYALQSGGAADTFFSIDARTGDIRLKSALDYESQKRHTFVVTATDGGAPGRSSSVQVNIVVQDVNDKAPVFSQSTYTVDLDESTPVNTRFMQVTATDMDTGSNGLVTYSLQQGPSSHVFGIFANDGFVYNKVPLDREQTEMYVLRVVAKDGGMPAKSSTAEIHINVLDANDNTPVFLEDSYHFYIEENLPSGSHIGTVRATDSDQRDSDQLRYSVIGASSAVAVDPRTGQLRTQRALDREEREEYSFSVSVSDQGSPPHTATVNVRVTVLDVNDNSPVFDRRDGYVADVLENQPKGTVVAQVSARDADKGENGTVTYTFVENNPDTAYFSLHGTTGVITTSEVLDHETKKQYVFSVRARDAGSPPQQTTTSVQVRVEDINENPPVFDAPEISLQVDDGAPAGTILGYVRAHDADSGDGARIQYYVVDGNLFGTFTINRTTGEVKAAKPVDYEVASSYTIIVQAMDDNPVNPMGSTVPLHISVNDVNDNAPEFEDNPIVVTVREHTEVGSVVATLVAVDQDSGPRGEVRYRLAASEDEEPWFSVDALSGQLKVLRDLDYETLKQISVGIVAEDQAPPPEPRLSSMVTVLVVVEDVNDHAPVFASRPHVTVLEDEPLGFPVLHLIATDADSHEAGRVTYSIAGGNQKGHFMLDSNSGLLTIGNPLDREDTAEFELLIMAKDHGHPQRSATTTLSVNVFDVNDNAPQFDKSVYNATVRENEPPHSAVITIHATDSDAGENAVLQYIIPGGIADGKFSISPFTGEITTNATLDREARDSWVVTAYVRDSAFPSLYDTTTVLVHVLDENDNAPRFKHATYRLQVPENTQLAVVHTVIAMDPDAGDNGRITYSIAGGNEDGHFAIDATTGELSCTDLDRETKDSYNLTIRAVDAGSPPRSSLSQVSVTVLDDNDNDPHFLKGLYFTNIPEDVAPDRSILHVQATDPDLGLNALVSYAIDHNAEGLFRIDNNTGVIYTAGEFDREKKSRYRFEVYATDSGLYGPRTRAVRVDVTIDDVNDNPPVFTEVPFKADISQNYRVGQFVVKVVAEDRDLGENADITYRFDTPSDYFELNADSGEIKTRQLLEPAAVTLHRLNVVATDGGQPPLSATGMVEIQVGNAPGIGTLRFINSTYNFYLDENSGRGTYVGAVQARFVRGGPSAISYSFASGNEDDTFRIEPSVGQITVNSNRRLDYETNKRLRLTVTASANNVHGYTTVWVNLRDVNDNQPRFTQQRYVSSVWEGNTRGTYVTQISATDADEGRNGRVSYSIIGGNSQNAFVIDPPNTGIVKTNIILDREIKDSYRLEIEAADEGSPVQTSRCTLKISVIDVNDNAPFFPSYPPVTVPESVQLGTEVLQVTANDVDLTPDLIYNFTAGGNPDHAFSIDRFSGRIAVARRLDYETSPRYVLEVQASDTVHNVTTRVIVRVRDENDNPPEFSQQSYQVTLPELTGPNYSVITVTASDRDAGENARVTYSMLAVSEFSIDANTGTIRTNATVQYNPSQPTVHLVVTARDHGNPVLSAVVAVRVQVTDVNNHAPTFLQSKYRDQVSEDQQKGYTVLIVTASDDDDSYENKKIDYSIVGGNEEQVFQISTDPLGTGELILIGELDRERTARYDLTIEARDRGAPPLSSSTAVELVVGDVNDNPPVFSSKEYRASIKEDEQIGVSVLRVEATDADEGNNGRVVFEIASGNDDRKFQMDPNSGILSVSNNLDFETRKVHRLIIKAEDSSPGTRMSAFTTVIVNVSDVNEFGPKFPVLMYLETVYEGVEVGSYVFTAHANDQDGGVFGRIEYQILGDDVPFSIDPITGVVTTTAEFTLPQDKDFRFHIQATDAGDFRQSVVVSVSVARRDDVKPRFNKPTYSFSVPGNAKAGYEVGQIIATGADGTQSRSTMYYLEDKNEYFEIGEATGLIVVIKDLKDDNSDRRKRFVPRYHSSHRRVKRALEENKVELVVVATSSRVNALESKVPVVLEVNRTCPGCALSSGRKGKLSGVPMVLVIVFAIVAVILIVVIIIMYLRGRDRKRHPPENVYDDSFDSLNVHAPPVVPNGAPPQYAELAPPQYLTARHTEHNVTTSELSDQSHSASSGRGSAEDADDVDEEIRMINATPLQTKQLRMPDSGIQQDDDAVSEQSVNNHQEYLARLGIDTSKIKVTDSNSTTTTSNKPAGLASSVESMHQFSDEGGGEGDGMDIHNVYSKMGNMQADETVSATDGIRQYNYAETEPTNPGSLSSVINSEEEFSGSYNWDYLLDWGPQYQPLAHVFSEIARLKDDNIKPKKTPTHIVPQRPHQIQANINAHMNKVLPPPLITNAPPKAVLAQPLSNRPSQGSGGSASSTASNNSARTSHLTSMPTPRSPISHESSFTSAALSPSFTPSLSPLATRSPSISPLATPSAAGSQASGPATPPQRHQRQHGGNPNGITIHIAASSESEQEIHI